jgi:hypothetical protein
MTAPMEPTMAPMTGAKESEGGMGARLHTPLPPHLPQGSRMMPDRRTPSQPKDAQVRPRGVKWENLQSKRVPVRFVETVLLPSNAHLRDVVLK